jgi:hypothetical protein
MFDRYFNLPALGKIGSQANRHLLQVEQISHGLLLSEEAFQKVNRSIQIASQRTSTLRFADPQVQALSSALLLFQLLPTGFLTAISATTQALCSACNRLT